MTEVKKVKKAEYKLGITDYRLKIYLNYIYKRYIPFDPDEYESDSLYELTNKYKELKDDVILKFFDRVKPRYTDVFSFSKEEEKLAVMEIKNVIRAYQQYLHEGYTLMGVDEKTWNNLSRFDINNYWILNVNDSFIDKLSSFNIPSAPPAPSPFPEFLKKLEMKRYGEESPINWEREIDEYQPERRRRLSKLSK